MGDGVGVGVGGWEGGKEELYLTVVQLSAKPPHEDDLIAPVHLKKEEVYNNTIHINNNNNNSNTHTHTH